MSDVQIVFLGQKGEIRQGKLKNSSLAGLASTLKKKEPPSLLGKFIWKQKCLFLFGYLDGKANQENQHHLPAPLEGMTFYGDIVVLASTDPNSYASPVSLKTADYETFYTNRLEGEEDEEIEEEVEEVIEEEIIEEEVEEDTELPVEEEEDIIDDEPPIEKPTRSRAKKIIATVIEEPEILDTEEIQSTPRLKVLDAIRVVFEGYLPTEEQIHLESIIFQTTFDFAIKHNIRKCWPANKASLNTQFQDLYLATSRRIIGNLNPKSYVKNKNLWDRYMNKELTLEQIAYQNYYELCPEQWQVMVDKQVKRERIQLEGDFSRATEKWQCNGCKMRKCTYYELQTRSADEPMTIFIHCLNCGKRWTQ